MSFDIADPLINLSFAGIYVFLFYSYENYYKLSTFLGLVFAGIYKNYDYYYSVGLHLIINP